MFAQKVAFENVAGDRTQKFITTNTFETAFMEFSIGG